MKTLGCFTIYLLLSVGSATSKGVVREYCDEEEFIANCSENEVVVMEQAQYGRMRANRCATEEKGNMGCSADVLHMMDKRCSGRQDCRITHLARTFMERNECDRELSSYLSAGYSCVKVEPDVRMCDPDFTLRLNKSVTHLGSLRLRNSSLHCSSGRVMIALAAGQQLNISLIDLSLEDNVMRGRSCVPYGTVEDAQTRLGAELCGGQTREKWVWLSNSNRIELRLDLPREMPNFVLILKAFGCPDIVAPERATVERTNDVSKVMCTHTDQVWELVCRNNHWLGTLGNCTDNPVKAPIAQEDEGFLPSDITVALIAAAGFIICVAILATGINCWRRNSLATQLASMQEKMMKIQKGEEGESEYMFPIYKGGTGCADTEDALYDFCFQPANKNASPKVVQVAVSGTTVRPVNPERMSLMTASIERGVLPTVDENSMLVSHANGTPLKESHYKTLIVRHNDGSVSSPATTTSTTSTAGILVPVATPRADPPQITPRGVPNASSTVKPQQSNTPKAPPRAMQTLPLSANVAPVTTEEKPPMRSIQTLPPPPLPPAPRLDTPTEPIYQPLPPPPPPITEEEEEELIRPTSHSPPPDTKSSPEGSQDSNDSTILTDLDNMATLPLRSEAKESAPALPAPSNTNRRTHTITSDIGHMYAVPEKCLYENLKTVRKT